MRPNPYVILALAVLFAISNTGAFFFGRHVGKQGEQVAAATAGDKAVRQQNAVNNAIDAAGADTRANVAGALNDTRSNTHAAIERIRTVVVPGPCRDVDPVIVQQAGEAVDRINAKIRSGLRPGTAGTDRPATGD